MSIRTTVHHIDTGPAVMYPVDAAAATGSHPHEWSRVPWTDEARAAARPHLEKREKRQREEQERASGTTFVAGQNVLGPQVALGPQMTETPLKPGGQTGDPGTNVEIIKRLQSDLEMSKVDAGKAGDELKAAKEKGDDKATSRAQAVADAANAKVADAQAKLDAAKK